MNSVSFNGSFKSDIYIKSKQKDDFAEKKAKIVELDKNNENDDAFQENIILKDLVKELKSEIYELRQNFIKSNNNMNIIRKENEKLKKEIYKR